ncbi:MAG: ATP-binding protein, partial [Saprospiraceae bacterium]|nr:ATP-binding protein [Saprospiraceae bacterium]
MAKRKPTEGKSNDPPLSAGKTRTEVSIYDKYSSKIRDLYLELDQYEFFHSPFAFDLPDRRFIGRQKVVSRLKMILRNSKTKSGAYLITGFRGMGKTSIVRKAIREVNLEHVPKEKKRERPFWEIVNPLRNRKLRRVLGILFLLVLAYYLAYFLFANDHGPWHWDKPFHLEDFGALGSRLLELLRWPTFKEPFLNNLLKLAFLFLFLFLFGGFVFWLTEWMLSRVDRKKKSKWNRFEPIEINLPQEEIREEDVLKQIAKQLYLYLQKFEQSNFTRHRRIYWVVRRLIYLPRFLFSNVSLSGYVQLQRTLKQLESLNRRINAQVSNLQELTVNPSFAPSIFGGLARMPLSIFGFSSKDQLNYPIASAKEIEQELIEIFRNIDDIRVKKEVNYQLLVPEFIFIIDELDKIEPNYNYNIGDREASDPSFDDQKSKFATERIRKRQETVARLLANLKSFLNVAMAKFIFIGGREMYDASLADIADRDSFYSSIFHDIIYVNSFFKDKIEVRSGVTRMTEAYLVSLLLPEAYLDRYIQKLHPDTTEGEPYRAPYYSLRVYYQYLLDLFCEHPLVKKDIEDQAWRELPFSTPGDLVHTDVLQAKQKAFKIIFLLQNFIIFLTYRSNGTPKKLVGLVEDYMSPYRKVLADAGEKYLQVDNPFADGQEHQDRVFLRFNYNQQYEIGLTSNLYRPYLIIHSRYLKALGDKFLFSNAFIIDHLLKFHPFGFSWRNLELIPEIILINKEPNLRSFIGDVISFMSNIMIRHTTSGLFQLKFYNKTANELKFISKISDLSAAAFNFTLDESLLIKRHYKKKLQELRNNYQHYDQQGLGNRYIHSMGFIQTILGDLHFYDKEFDDALLFYTDSIQTLRVPYDEKRITKHQVILLIRNRLKIGLTLEKMRAFDSAFSIYRELILDTPVFLRRLVDGEER